MSDAGTTMATDTKQATGDKSESYGSSEGKMYGLLAEFETPGAILSAAKKVNEAGYKWWDCCVPFPVHGLDKAMGVRPTILPIRRTGSWFPAT